MSAGIFEIGDLVSTMNFFSIPFTFTFAVRFLFYREFYLSFQFCRYSILILRILRQLLHTLAKCPFFPQCCSVYPMPGICGLGSNFVRYKVCKVCRLSFGFGFFLNGSIFCISFISFSRHAIKGSDIVFSGSSFRMYSVWTSQLLSSSRVFSFISLSPRFVSVVAVINFEMSRFSAVIPSRAHSFQFLPNSSRQKSSGVSV